MAVPDALSLPVRPWPCALRHRSGRHLAQLRQRQDRTWL